MGLGRRLGFIASLCVLACLLPCLCLASTDQALVILKSDQFSDTEATIASLQAIGVHVEHVFPPRTVIAAVPAEVESRVLDLANVERLSRVPVLASSDDTAAGVGVWNSLLQPRPAAENKGAPLIGDALKAPVPATAESIQPALNAPGANQTSSFMVGKVAVGIILPESNGGTENWTVQRQAQVLDQIVNGLNWWAMKGGSAAHLTFYYYQRMSAPTQYEPISMQGMEDEETWVTDIFQNMGYTTGTRIDRARTFLNEIRTALHTDWAYTFIVVDSLNDADGRFNDGYFAWAYLGGPYVIMTWDNDGWGEWQMNLVATHETGHIFGAADEYCERGYACCDFGNYGYLGAYNGNCEQGNPNSISCMMRYNDNALCQYTRDQIGWRDSDSDGLPDTIDNPVTIICNVGTSDDMPSIGGLCTDTPCPSPSGTAVTINKISAIKYRIDTGAWRDALPTDGWFDSDMEYYSAKLYGLENGTHQMEAQAFSDSGNSSPIVSTSVSVAYKPRYMVMPAEFSWIDPSSHPALSMTDDSVSPVQTIPFDFEFYGTHYNQLYVGSNGLLGFVNSGLSTYSNSSIPSTYAPNAAIYPYWDDLNPGAGGTVRIGTVGTVPKRKLVVSWVGVPRFGASSYLTFQVALCEGSNEIQFSYSDVVPSDSGYGAGRSATIGIEDAAGAYASQYSYNGSTLLSNRQSIVFTHNAPLSWIKQQPDNQSVELGPYVVTYTDKYNFYVEDDSRTTGLEVDRPTYGVNVGDRVYVRGTTRTDYDGQRYIYYSGIWGSGTGTIAPLALTNKAVGGGDWMYNSTSGRGQRGVYGGRGLNNIGLLVRTTGRVTAIGGWYIYIDDGSGLKDGTMTGSIPNLGLRVDCAPDGFAIGDVVQVTGISATVNSNGVRHILTRNTSDIVIRRRAGSPNVGSLVSPTWSEYPPVPWELAAWHPEERYSTALLSSGSSSSASESIQ